MIDLLLPHRAPFRLVDRILAYAPGERLEAEKAISTNEPVFAGHFPDFRLWPGVYTLEGLAQTAGLLLALDALCDAVDGGWTAVRRDLRAVSAHRRMEPVRWDPEVAERLRVDASGVLASSTLRWRRPVFAGDALVYVVSGPRRALGMLTVDVEARVDGERVADGELTLAPRPRPA